jgi:hypothetical protein
MNSAKGRTATRKPLDPAGAYLEITKNEEATFYLKTRSGIPLATFSISALEQKAKIVWSTSDCILELECPDE